MSAFHSHFEEEVQNSVLKKIGFPKFCFIIFCIFLAAVWIFFTAGNKKDIWKNAGLFSWDSSVMETTEREALFQLMAQQRLTVLYQYIDSDTTTELVQEFLTAASEQGIAVWMLTGEPSWGLDSDGKHMIEEIQRAANYHIGLEESFFLRGIVMDCEPYLTEQWEEEPEWVMASWISAMKQGYAAAKEQGLLFSACIPYYLDTKGYSDYLEELIYNGCDALAIMNYYKGKEAEHIETEVTLARGASCPVTVIYELQNPGKHGLLEVNTYYEDGLEALHASWRNIVDTLGLNGLSVSLHEYKALQEVMNRE